MKKVAIVIAGAPAAALIGAYLIMAVWDRLIRSELVPNATFAWFPVVAILWGSACIISAIIFAKKRYKTAEKPRLKSQKRKSPSTTRIMIFIAISVTSCFSLRSPAYALESDITSYTSELIKLFDLFGKLDKAAADRMKQNERYLLAKEMLRLSSSLYHLTVAKNEYMHEVVWSIRRKNISPDMYMRAVVLQRAVQCVSRRLTGNGARLGALVEINGAAVEESLRKGLEAKSLNLESMINHLGFDPKSPDLEAIVIKDATKASKISNALYKMTADFAHILDPNVIPPNEATVCSEQ